METLIAAYPPAAWAALLATGILIGLLAGLLGVGGGIVAVPVLLEIFEFMGVSSSRAVSLAVGTAQASILIASTTATAAHWRAGTIDRELVRSWLPALMVGAIIGLALGSLAPSPSRWRQVTASLLGRGSREAFSPRCRRPWSVDSLQPWVSEAEH